MIRKIKGTITNFILANRRFCFSCIGFSFAVLVAAFATFYLFSSTSPKAQLSNCTSAATLNTAANNYSACTPVLCSSLNDADAKNPDSPGGYNCYYMKRASDGALLRPCKVFGNQTAVSGPLPRENCADLVDLPVCDVFTTKRPGINCVKEGKDIPNGSGTRGVNYAVHNTDAIRFCGSAEAGCTGACADSDETHGKCRKIKCHQMRASQTPTPGAASPNCSITSCGLLTVDELKVSDGRFTNESKKYCEGSNLKCYTLFKNGNGNPSNNSENLQYMIYRLGNPMCLVHNCPPDSTACGANDVTNIPSDTQYRADYTRYINGNMDVNAGLCTQMVCKPVAIRKYRCTNASGQMLSDSSLSTTLNSECRCEMCGTGENCNNTNDNCPDGTKPSPAQTCSGGYCNKTIDCNKPGNNGEPECQTTSSTSSASADATVDVNKGWFWRPTPPSYVVDPTTGFIKNDIAAKIKVNRDTGDVKRDYLCYKVGDGDWGHQGTNSPNDLEALGWGRKDVYDDGALIKWFVFWHIAQPTRSPQICGNSAHPGQTRGVGYASLCGTNWNLFANPSDSAGYIKGYAKTIYSNLERPKYQITACLRYQNSGNLASCGERECRFDVSDGSASAPTVIQWCGFDECRVMTVSDEDIDRCSMAKHGDVFDGSANPKPDCISDDIDVYVRMRTRKYGRKLCVFVDHKGAVAYDAKNYNGTETLADDVTCVDGETLSESGECQGKNTNSSEGAATVWRTVKLGSSAFQGIQYIGNVLTGNKRGYIDLTGRFFGEQDCAKVPLRIGPPRFYQVATAINSKGLFEPPVYVVSSRIARGGAISSAITGENLGRTDFLKPEIDIGFGMVKQKLSLGAGFIGNDSPPESNPTSPWEKVLQSITVNAGGSAYQADLFVLKKYTDAEGPLLCLYRRVNDASGMPVDPVEMQCVKRNKPEISDIYNNKTRMNLVIKPDSGNVFNSAKMKFRMIYGHGANNLNNSYGINGQTSSCTSDDQCSKEIVFENPNVGGEVCSTDLEAYKICSKRDNCSQLVFDCAQNEIDLHNASINNQSTAQYDAVKANCNGPLLRECNLKFGIETTNASDFFSQIDNSVSAHSSIDPNYQNFQSLFLSTTNTSITVPNRYGWFNEMCIAVGFEDKLKNIIAHKSENGVLGKCLIDTTKSSYAISKCNIGGGKAPYCVCIEATAGVDPGAQYEIRKETPREAGLCMDIPIPKFCPAIDHTITNDTPESLNYVPSSVANSVQNSIYTDSIHTAGYNNTNGVHKSHQERAAAGDTNHAEYGAILGATNTVYGVCKGFWTEKVSGGSTLKPTLNCKIDGTWELPNPSDPTSGNLCQYKACDAVTTTGILQGAPANNSYQNDYALGENSDEMGRKHGYALWSPRNKTNDFLQDAQANACITGYKRANDVLPTRYCKQNGTWEEGSSDFPLRNQCQRIMCPPIKRYGTTGEIDLPNDTLTPANIAAWQVYGGAEFINGGRASRSDSFVPAESIVTGSCNAQVGFFRTQNVPAPTLECNHLGQWVNLKNPCKRELCPAITEGNANWVRTDVTGNNNTPVTGTCVTGSPTYVPNPYRGAPTRECEITSFKNDTDEWYNSSWGPITNPCINKCPASGTDNVGWTAITLSNGASTPVIWPVKDFGQYAYVDNCAGADANSYQQGRVNHCFKLRRYCNYNGSWSNPEPMCVASNGQIGNAKYNDNDSLTTGTDDAELVDGDVVTGVCINGHWGSPNNSTTNLPQRQCFPDAGKYVDKVYWKMVNGVDCERKKCYVAQNTNFSNMLRYTETSGLYDYNTSATLVCQSGKYFNYGTLSVTCGSDGQWNGTPNGACRDPNPCNYANPSMDVRKYCPGWSDCCIGKTYWAAGRNHGDVICYDNDGGNGGGCAWPSGTAIECRQLNKTCVGDGVTSVWWSDPWWR